MVYTGAQENLGITNGLTILIMVPVLQVYTCQNVSGCIL